MAVRKDEVQLEITFITDESKALARTINNTKELQAGLDKLRGQIRSYENELKKTNISEARRAELLEKIRLAELGVADSMRDIVAAGREVQRLDLSRVTPAQLTQRARQLAQAMALIPASTPAFREMETELGQINAQLATLRQRARGVQDSTPRGGLLQSIIGVAGGIGLADVLGKVRQLFTDSLRFFNIAQKGQAQLEAVLKSTGGAAGRSIEQLQAQSALLQELTLFDDDATQASQGLLLTFTNVRTEIFDQSIPAIQDMATALATASGEQVNLEAATIQVGKALNDPIAGITALRKVGVSFTEQQREQIKVLVQSGKVQQAQAIILAELNKEFGGSAAAAAKADVGFTQLTNKFENLLEKVGGLIATGLNPLLAAGAGVIDFFDELIDPVGAATKAFDDQAGKVKQLDDNLPGLLARYEELKGKTNLTKTEQEELATVIKQIGDLTPGAITQVDLYGNALEISAGKSRQLYQAEKDRLAFVNKESLSAIQEEISETIKLVKLRKQFIEQGGERKLVEGIQEGRAQLQFVKATEEQIQAAREELRNLSSELSGAQEEFVRLSGAQIDGPSQFLDESKGSKKANDAPAADPKAAAEKVKAAQEARLAELQAGFDRENLILEGQVLRQETTEQAAAERRLQLEASFYERKMALLQKFGQAQTAEYLKAENQLTQVRIQQENAEYLRLETATVDRISTLAIKAVTSENQADEAKLRAQELAQGSAEKSQQDYLERKRVQEENFKASVIAIEEAKNEAVTLFFQISTDLLGKDEASRKRYASAIKAFKIGEVITSGLMEIQRIYAKYAGVPGGQALALTESIPAGIRTAAAVAKIAVQKFAEGGLTGQRILGQPNITPLPNGDNMLAYVRTGEVILNQRQQQALGGPDTFRRIGVPGFADGGAIPNTTPTAAAIPVQASDQVALRLAMMTADELRGLRVDMNNWSRRLKADVVYFDIEDAGTRLNGLRSDASL